ncbi:MAG TPA: NAD(P)-dependent oxidoreductase [Roseiarcus sp.]|nr:NAD(P)-dependent oxidoreductase [Roseiarcus sp.]
MAFLVTGGSGHLGEALMRTLKEAGRTAIGLDVLPGEFTDAVGSIADRRFVARSMEGVEVVLHAATLHKPHVATHEREAFVEANVKGTLILLEEARRAGVRAFVLTSTTSAFGDALKPPPGEPAAWLDESVAPVPKNIYGVSKTAAEDLCQLFWRNEGLACVVLRTSRFFPESDDDPTTRAAFADDNAKVNEFLFRRVAIEDVVEAHLLAAEQAPAIGFRRYIVSATTPFRREDCARLRVDAPSVVRERVSGWEDEYARRGWRMFASIDRVYDNALARRELGWRPKWDFAAVVKRLRETGDIRGPLAKLIGEKGYHAGLFSPDSERLRRERQT